MQTKYACHGLINLPANFFIEIERCVEKEKAKIQIKLLLMFQYSLVVLLGFVIEQFYLGKIELNCR